MTVSFVAAWAILATVICVVPVVSAFMPLSMCWNATGGSCTGVAGREDCHVAVFAAGAVGRRAVALVVMVATFISLVAAGGFLLR